MVLSALLLLMFSAMVVFFIDEIQAAIKKYGSVPVIGLCGPILLFSWLIQHFYMHCMVVLLAINYLFVRIVNGFLYFLPHYSFMRPLAQIMVLWLLTALPLWILEAWSLRRRYQHFPYVGLLSAIIWIILACLVVVLN